MEWSRRGLLALALACAFGALVADIRAAPAGPDRVDLRRAQASYAALMRSFRASGNFAETSVDGATPPATAYAWPASQAIAASLAMAKLPGGGAYARDARWGLAALESYWQDGALSAYASLPAGADPAGLQYYDDNEWIALDLVAAYSLTGDREQLARARSIFELVASAWGTDAAYCPGGVYWVRSPVNRDRNAVTTENGALLALRLYELTHRLRYLQWAVRMRSWSERCLGRSDGLLADHLTADGSRDERAWSYNQGAAIATDVLLAEATGDDLYLDAAERRATTALGYFGSFATEPRIFVAVFFRDLAVLDAVRSRPVYRRALRSYADQAWRTARRPASGLFAGAGPPVLLDQAAMVQIYALLAAAPVPTFSKPQ